MRKIFSSIEYSNFLPRALNGQKLGQEKLYVGLAQPKEDRQKMLETLHQVSAEVKVGASHEIAQRLT